MIIKRKYKILLLSAFLFAAMFGSGCNEAITDNPVANRPPETSLFLFPDSSITKQKSRLKVHWWGDDPDGIVIGFYFKWGGIDSVWHFTASNDSIFSLPIGSNDTTYNFMISAVDNNGNAKYDESVESGGINFGAEPFEDKNNNGIYDSGEPFTDIGAVDPTPAELKFPIKNTAPEVSWTKESVLPSVSYPVMTFGWNAEDLDGNSTIVNINVALNDTASGVVSLDGSVRLVTLIASGISGDSAEMKILIDGSENKVNAENLKNLKLDAANKFFVQAVDISGAKSKFIQLPDSGSTWFVQKPKSELLVIDDYPGNTGAAFYEDQFNSLRGGVLNSKINTYDIENEKLPYEFLTFLETVKLFDYVLWYSSTNPRIDLANLIAQKYIQGGGHIAFSMTFEDSSANFPFDLGTLQNFLPIDSLGQKNPVPFLLSGANLLKSDQNSDYPQLKTSGTTGYIRTFFPNSITSHTIYDISSSQLSGHIALMNNTNNLFFIGMPLHMCDGIEGNVKIFLEKLFFDVFGMQP